MIARLRAWITRQQLHARIAALEAQNRELREQYAGLRRDVEALKRASQPRKPVAPPPDVHRARRAQVRHSA